MFAMVASAAAILGSVKLGAAETGGLGGRIVFQQGGRASGLTATMTYRLVPSASAGTPADAGLVVSSGDVVIQSGGGRRRLSLKTLGMANRHTQFFSAQRAGCGAGSPLSVSQTPSRERYLVIESAEEGKGCSPEVRIVALATLAVIPQFSLDHAYLHRFEVVPALFHPRTALRVARVETFAIPVSYPVTSWTVSIITGRRHDGRIQKIFLVDAAPLERPFPNERVMIGKLELDAFLRPVNATLDDVIRLSTPHEAKWLRTQPPSPRALNRSRHDNELFSASQRLAWSGRFTEALADFESALGYVDDKRLRTLQAASVPKLRHIIADVRAKRLTVREARWYWVKP